MPQPRRNLSYLHHGQRRRSGADQWRWSSPHIWRWWGGARCNSIGRRALLLHLPARSRLRAGLPAPQSSPGQAAEPEVPQTPEIRAHADRWLGTGAAACTEGKLPYYCHPGLCPVRAARSCGGERTLGCWLACPQVPLAAATAAAAAVQRLAHCARHTVIPWPPSVGQPRPSACARASVRA